MLILDVLTPQAPFNFHKTSKSLDPTRSEVLQTLQQSLQCPAVVLFWWHEDLSEEIPCWFKDQLQREKTRPEQN